MTQSHVKSPFAQGFRQKAEWQAQERVWLAWPSAADLWEEDLPGAQRAVTAFARAIQQGGVPISMLVPTEKHREQAAAVFKAQNNPVDLVVIPFGDIWLRDIAPIFVQNKKHENAAVCFAFNGWGKKYILPHDAEVSGRVAAHTGLPVFAHPMILEGGAIEPNGEGTALTTRQCLLNPNRNPHLNEAQITAILRDTLGLEHLIWLDEGILNDHTDGHIDNIARFISPEAIVCMEPSSESDPNAKILRAILKSLQEAKSAAGRSFEIVTVPSPGDVRDKEGNPMAASFLNFLITNKTVSVPVYNTPNDEIALKRYETIFPGKKIIGIDCRDLLTGGGALHCISQPQFA